MYIICNQKKYFPNGSTNIGTRIFNTDCISCIGYDVNFSGKEPRYDVYAYSGEARFCVSSYPLEAQAQCIVDEIADALQNGEETYTIYT